MPPNIHKTETKLNKIEFYDGTAALTEEELEAFVNAVAYMRQAQKLYFKYRCQDTLKRAKRMEEYVDSWLKKIRNEQAQGSLLQ